VYLSRLATPGYGEVISEVLPTVLRTPVCCAQRIHLRRQQIPSQLVKLVGHFSGG
jgi:hypothetical protein